MRTKTIISATIVALAAAQFATGQQKVSERTALSSGDLVPANDILPIVDVSAGSAGSKKITINNLFTGWGFTTAGKNVATAADASAQRTTLGLAIGTNVQAWDADLDSWAAKTAPSGTAVGTSDSQTLTNKTIGSGTVMTLGSDGTGDIYYRASGGALTRLAAGTNGHVLTLASGLPSWAAGGGGGGGLTNWTEAVNSSSPNGTIPAVSFTATNAATSVDVVLAPKANGGIMMDVPDNTSTGGNKRGLWAVDLQSRRTTAAQVASGGNSGILAGLDNTASGSQAVVLGGEGNAASGTNSIIAGGGFATATASYTGVFGGVSNDATATYAASVGGANNTASGQYSATIAGRDSTASGESSIASGYFATTRGIYGAVAHAAGNQATSLGAAQRVAYILRIGTTNATITEATADGAAGSSSNRIILPNNAAYKFTGQAIAREPATGDVKSWDVSGTIKRGANAAATAIVGTVTVTVKDADAGASAWTLGIDADTTTGSLRAQVTGETSKTIRWLAEIETLELQ